MEEYQNRIDGLLEKFSSGTLTEGEFNEFCELVKLPANEDWLARKMERELPFFEYEPISISKLDQLLAKVKEAAGSRQSLVVSREEVDPSTLRSRNEFGTGEAQGAQDPQTIDDGPSTPLRIQLWKRIAVAASIVGVLFVGYWMLRPSTTLSPSTDGPSTVAQDVPAPDKNRAQIKLADGTVVYLDSVGNGELAKVNGVKLVKTEDGKIVYSGEAGVVSGELKYHTLSNPRGSEVINMTLADGSRVWLNAGSSVTYPVVFIGKERNVTITGEAYFEIAHDKTKPFKVSKGETTVEVLGTHFNVNAYDDESEIKVTLLEGSVRVQPIADSRKSVVIKPGQQAKIVSGGTSTGSVSVVSGVDLEAVMAWKNGQFSFDNADLKTVMKQIARWYDVEIVYEGALPDEEFNGGTSRQENVSAVLKVLEATGKIKFRVEGKKVFVRR